ncbi:MAG: efflux RND transporter periplasmic adaptor subunit, partial [Thermoanaerobacteraceae bacterium]|nr:efflux RND transporter periplasmic adaptor subunit [Thermoanaerobacteraceae bacterium]
IIFAAIFLVVVAFFIFKIKFQPKIALALPTVKAIKGDISSKISAIGTVKTAQEQEVYSAVQGVVEYVAEEGQQVRKGDMILKIDDEELRLEFEQAQSKVKQQTLELSRLLEGPRLEELEKARIKYQDALAAYESAMDDYERNQELFDLGGISEKDLLNIQRELDVKKNQLSIMEFELKLLENPDEKDIALRRAALEEAEKSLANIEKKLNKTVIYAEFDGIVLEQKIKPGMTVTPGTLLLRIGSLSDLQIDFGVNEYDAALIKVGQKAIITGEGFGDKTYNGEVVKIAPSASVTQTSRGNETVVKAAIKVIEHDEKIKPGFSATVEITVEEKNDAVLIPLECVTEGESGKQVMVVKDGNISKREVKTGIENELYVEIIQGLGEGEEVLQNPSQDGDSTGDA